MTANRVTKDLSKVQLLTVDEAAEVLRQHPKTVYRRASAGELPWINIAGKGKRAKVRFRLADLEAFLDDRTHEVLKQRRTAA